MHTLLRNLYLRNHINGCSLEYRFKKQQTQRCDIVTNKKETNSFIFVLTVLIKVGNKIGR